MLDGKLMVKLETLLGYFLSVGIRAQIMKVFNSSYYGRLCTTGENGNYNQHMRCPCTITVMEVGA